ncbi:MAG: ribonuclease E inhibitor RraB [Gammaproteobacteria bacterium]|nr:ribonuclease E inhibitor RraB [Gammaproteobacteria bacterium]
MIDPIGLVIAIIVAIVGYRYAAKKQQSRTLDGHVLKRLEDAGYDLTQTHKIEFWFFGNIKTSIDNAATDLRRRQYEVHVTETEDDPRYIIRAIKPMKPELAALQGLRKEFTQLAKIHGVEYDGWGTEYVTS